MARHDKIYDIYRRVEDFYRKTREVLDHAVRSFITVDAPEGAASMAYFAVFSLFPLLLLLVAVGSLVLQSQEAQQEVFELVSKAFPISREPIARNLQRLLELRGTVGIVGMVSLLWSASAFFSTLAYHLNRAWPTAVLRGFFKGRLVAVAIVAGLAGLLAFSLVSNAVVHLLLRYIPSWEGLSLVETVLRKHLSDLISFLLRFFLLWGLYRWVPNTKVRWSEALGGALVAVTVMELTTVALSWYLGSGLVGYELVYGSLSAMLALMLWIYVNSLITLFGAHLSAAISQRPHSISHVD